MTPAPRKPIVLVRADGHRDFGLGHLYRSLSVALAAREQLGAEPVYLSLASTLETGFGEILAGHGIAVEMVSGADPYVEEFALTERLVGAWRPGLVMTDLLTPDPSDRDLQEHPQLRFASVPAYIERLKSLGVPVLSFTDEPGRIAIRPDVVIDPSCLAVPEEGGAAQGTTFCLGADYYPLGPDFRALVGRPKETPDRARELLLAFGGSDHNRYTARVAGILAELGRFRITAVVGPAMAERDDVLARLGELGVRALDAPASIAGPMFEADLAVTTGGNSVYEFAALGTPAVTMCVRERQRRNADVFQRRGALVNLGIGDDVPEAALAATIGDLADDPERRAAMSAAGPRLVDGKGLDRIVGLVGASLAQAQRASA